MSRQKAIPNTPTQNFLRTIGACIEGRRAVGGRTLWDAWRRSQNAWHMYWLLNRLREAGYATTHCPVSVLNNRARTRAALRTWLEANREWVKLPFGV